MVASPTMLCILFSVEYKIKLQQQGVCSMCLSHIQQKLQAQAYKERAEVEILIILMVNSFWLASEWYS